MATMIDAIYYPDWTTKCKRPLFMILVGYQYPNWLTLDLLSWQVSKRIEGFKLRPETTGYHKVCPKGMPSLDLYIVISAAMEK
jgi:hypothetical protein